MSNENEILNKWADRWIRDLLELTDKEREIVMERVANRFCTYCWSNDPGCHCGNDE